MGMYWQPGSLSSGREMTNFTPFRPLRFNTVHWSLCEDSHLADTKSDEDSNWALIAFTSEVNIRLFLVCILPASFGRRDTSQFRFNFWFRTFPHLIMFLLKSIQILSCCFNTLSAFTSSFLCFTFSSSHKILDSPPRSSKSIWLNSSPLYFSSRSSVSNGFSLLTYYIIRGFPPLELFLLSTRASHDRWQLARNFFFLKI